MTDDSVNPLGDMAEVLPPDTKLSMSPATAIAALGLSMSLKFHDINTVQDGTLYQQFKLEGKNLRGLHINDVLDLAKVLEQHILSAPSRMTDRIMESLMDSFADAADDDSTVEGTADDNQAHEEYQFTIDQTVFTHFGSWSITGTELYRLLGDDNSNKHVVLMLKTDDEHDDIRIENNDECAVDLDEGLVREFYTLVTKFNKR